MWNILIALIALVSVSACTTAERDVAVGAGVGAIAGQAIGGDTESTLIGAGLGALAGYIITRNRNGECVYRDRRTGRRFIRECPEGY